MSLFENLRKEKGQPNLEQELKAMAASRPWAVAGAEIIMCVVIMTNTAQLPSVPHWAASKKATIHTSCICICQFNLPIGICIIFLNAQVKNFY